MKFWALVASTVFVVTYFANTSAVAQGAQVPFGGLKHDASQPWELGADSLTLNQELGTAEFKGKVVAGQGTLRIGANALTVKYSGADEANRVMELLTASGGVTLTNGDEAAEADRAVYVVSEGRITMTGSVILTQGGNALSGEKIVIDLNTGKAEVQGRVRTIFGVSGN